MGLTATAKNETHFEPIPAGTHHMVCYGVVDEGTQDVEWQGQKKKLYKVRIFWECPEERIDIERDGKKLNLPRVISKEYTLSLGDKASLRKDLVAWRGRDFTPDELEGFGLPNLIGANCLIQIVHIEKNGKTYANIASIAGLMKSMTKLKPESETMTYDMQKNGANIPATCPDWVKEIVKKSPEYNMLVHAAGHPDMTGQGEPIIEPEDYGVDMDDIPF
jgi:hypothetical protein